MPIDARSGVLTVNVWNTETTEGESSNSFDCKPNAELYQYFIEQEPIPVLLLIDKQAKWNQELENVYLVACEVRDDDHGHSEQHYEYELRPDDCCF